MITSDLSFLGKMIREAVMIGRFALGAALLIGLLGSAVAADLPTHKAAEPPPAPPFSWTGFYLGGFLGGRSEEHTSELQSL